MEKTKNFLHDNIANTPVVRIYRVDFLVAGSLDNDAKLQHWSGFSGIFASKAAPALEFYFFNFVNVMPTHGNDSA